MLQRQPAANHASMLPPKKRRRPTPPPYTDAYSIFPPGLQANSHQHAEAFWHSTRLIQKLSPTFPQSIHERSPKVRAIFALHPPPPYCNRSHHEPYRVNAPGEQLTLEESQHPTNPLAKHQRMSLWSTSFCLCLVALKEKNDPEVFLKIAKHP